MAWTTGIHGLPSAAAIAISHHAMLSPGLLPGAQLDGLMVFGFLSAVAAGTSYLRRHDGRIAMLTFAASLAASGVYGFLEGAWPLGLLETAWAIQAARYGLRNTSGYWARRRSFVPDLEGRQSRYREIFGSN